MILSMLGNTSNSNRFVAQDTMVYMWIEQVNDFMKYFYKYFAVEYKMNMAELNSFEFAKLNGSDLVI